jgi:hypothetical protein
MVGRWVDREKKSEKKFQDKGIAFQNNGIGKGWQHVIFNKKIHDQTIGGGDEQIDPYERTHRQIIQRNKKQ